MLRRCIAEVPGRAGSHDARGGSVPPKGSVAFAVPDFDPSVGGTTRQTRLQAEALQRRGYRVRIVSRRLHRSWKPIEVVDGLEVFRVGPPGRGHDVRALVALGSWLIRHRADIGILQIVMWPDAILAAAAGGLVRRTAVLWAIRGEIPAVLAGASSLKRRLQVRLRRSLLAQAEHVTLTSTMSSEFQAVGLRASNLVIPVPVDREHFRPPTREERDACRKDLGLPPDAFTVVYIGHLQARKAVDRLIEAVALLARDAPNARLLIVGGGRGASDDTESALEQQVEEKGLTGSVLFCGIVEDPRDHLWAADVLALASVKEGMPNSLLEGLACGLPCVAPASAGGDEVLDAETGIVPPSNEPAALAAAFGKLASDPDLRRRMGEAARRHSERFDVERVADRYVELYDRMLEKGRAE
jgi:glycosyltransferase involved in cell wall biosynthesis